MESVESVLQNQALPSLTIPKRRPYDNKLNKNPKLTISYSPCLRKPWKSEGKVSKHARETCNLAATWWFTEVQFPYKEKKSFQQRGKLGREIWPIKRFVRKTPVFEISDWSNVRQDGFPGIFFGFFGNHSRIFASLAGQWCFYVVNVLIFIVLAFSIEKEWFWQLWWWREWSCWKSHTFSSRLVMAVH